MRASYALTMTLIDSRSFIARVAVGHAVEVRDAVEDPPRFDPALKHVGQHVLDVRTDGRGGRQPHSAAFISWLSGQAEGEPGPLTRFRKWPSESRA
jgi:hypothetical protein